MSGGATVVPLKTSKPTPELSPAERAQLARLPAPLHSVREKGKQLLAPLLRNLFDRIDDALFEQADKASNNHAQNLFFESMREVRIQRRGLENRFALAIDRAFVQLTDQAPSESTENFYIRTSLEELTLAHDEDLEAMVAADSMINKANEMYAESLQHLTLRIDHLVPVKVSLKNNPLGPYVLCHVFVDKASALDVDIKVKLVLFKLFEKWVVNELTAVYAALNKLMIEANILPSVQQDLRQARHAERSETSHGNGAHREVAVPAAVGNGIVGTSAVVQPGGCLGEGVVADDTLRN